ncbi:MAG: SixA phosphatase family protein [Pyrinomonadaceae bacterium]
MKRLFLLRHAKSSWDDPQLADHDRPLNDRGRRAAPFMGRLMSERGFVPDVILSSTAKRARQTTELLKEAADFRTEIILDERIYDASPGALQQVVSEIDSHESAILIGHNPGIEAFIRYLTGDAEPMPTAALAVIDLAIDRWDQITNDCGTVFCVVRPKDEMR